MISTTPPSSPGSRNATSPSSAARAELIGERRLRAGDEELAARTAVIIATGSGALDAPDRRARRRRRLVESRDHDREGGAAIAVDPRRWRRRGRDGAGLELARLTGDDRRGRRADPPARGGVRRRAGRRRAARAGRRDQDRCRRHRRSPGRRCRPDHPRARGRQLERRRSGCSSRSVASPGSRDSASRPSVSRPVASRSTSTSGCASVGASGSTRSGTSTAGRC